MSSWNCSGGELRLRGWGSRKTKTPIPFWRQSVTLRQDRGPLMGKLNISGFPTPLVHLKYWEMHRHPILYLLMFFFRVIPSWTCHILERRAGDQIMIHSINGIKLKWTLSPFLRKAFNILFQIQLSLDPVESTRAVHFGISRCTWCPSTNMLSALSPLDSSTAAGTFLSRNRQHPSPKVDSAIFSLLFRVNL